MSKIKRDEQGKFLPGSNHLDSETAAEMGRKRWSKEREQNASELLKEAGYPNPEDAPMHLRLLADKAVQNQSGSISALLQFAKAVNGKSDSLGDDSLGWRRGQGPCPTCGSLGYPIPLSPEVAERLLEIMHRREQAKAKAPQTV